MKSSFKPVERWLKRSNYVFSVSNHRFNELTGHKKISPHIIDQPFNSIDQLPVLQDKTALFKKNHKHLTTKQLQYNHLLIV
jgi:hypothetical protein